MVRQKGSVYHQWITDLEETSTIAFIYKYICRNSFIFIYLKINQGDPRTLMFAYFVCMISSTVMFKNFRSGLVFLLTYTWPCFQSREICILTSYCKIQRKLFLSAFFLPMLMLSVHSHFFFSPYCPFLSCLSLTVQCWLRRPHGDARW